MSKAYSKFSLAGKTALVTGGGSGIGYYMSRGLALSGAKVIIAARREKVLEEGAEKLRGETGNKAIHCLKLDLSDRGSITEAVEQVNNKFGGADIFVGNAAQDIHELIESITDESMDRMFEVNVAANILLVRSLLPHMRKNKWGRVIFSSSAAVKLANAQQGMSVYAASKAAINSFSRYGASEAGRDGITFNCLNLGMYRTEMLQQTLDGIAKTGGTAASEAFLKDFVSNTSLGRLGNCEEVEGLIQLLASDAGGYITGADIPVDGGLSIMMNPNRAGL